MTNISNIFYWNLKSNKRVALSKLNDIKTTNLIRCKIKNDRIYIAPFDETDSKFNEDGAWKIIDKISEKYKTIEEFVIKYKSNKKWIWQNFYKKNNGDIEMAIKEEDMGLDSDKTNDTEKNDGQDAVSNKTNDIEKNDGQGVGGIISAETSTTSNDEDLEDFETIFNNLKFDDSDEKDEDDYITAETSKFEKIDENILTFFINKLPKKINDTNKIEKIKKEISKAKSIEDIRIIILNTYEEMGDVSKDNINNLLNLDSKSKLESGQASYSKGMGAFFKIQSIVNDGTLKSTNNMYNQIWNNLKSIYIKNRQNCNAKEKLDLRKNYNLFEEENQTNASDLAKLSVIYGKFLKNWKEGVGNQDIPNSKYFRNNMTSYFPEVLTPFTIIWGEKSGNKDCIDDKGHKAIELLKEKVGNGFEYSSISFPQSDYQPLFDSVLYFKSTDDSYKCIRLSTKGGKNGLGSQASILGLLTYFYKKEKLPQDIFSKKFFSLDASKYTNCYQDYMYAFAMKPENELALKILSAFMLAQSNQYHTIVDNIFEIIINQDEKYNKEFEEQLNFYNNITDKRRKKPAMIETLKTRVKGLIVQKYINDHKEFQNCVLAALKYASYDFAQVNYKETGNDGDDFHYEIFVQYPAIFDGEIRFELMQGLKFHKLKFHILGKNME